MKCLLPYILFALYIGSSGCRTTKSLDHKTIDFSTVLYVKVGTVNCGNDSTRVVCKWMSSANAKEFVDRWNAAESVGPCKYVVKYWVTVEFADGTAKTFRINGDHIKENDDECFDLGDPGWIDKLWQPD